ncbi:hypothetical protein KLQ90_001746 [Salmonella enterica]|nr:hypothetical protein [Salmonella enterica]
MTRERIELFNKLSANRMQPDDVKRCLSMSQHDFLTVLSDGAGYQLKKTLTRSEFAALAGMSKKAVYSYFASPDAKDYRSLSEDARIAIIWRIINSCSPARHHSRGFAYFVNNKLMYVREAYKVLGYSGRTNLNKKIREQGIKPGQDISHLRKMGNSGGTQGGDNHKPRLFIVNGAEVNLNTASKILGHKGGALYSMIKLRGINPGSDISHLIAGKVRKGNMYVVNNELLTVNDAAEVLGYTDASSLRVRIRRRKIKPGGDISDLQKRRTPQRKEDDKPG